MLQKPFFHYKETAIATISRYGLSIRLDARLSPVEQNAITYAFKAYAFLVPPPDEPGGLRISLEQFAKMLSEQPELVGTPYVEQTLLAAKRLKSLDSNTSKGS